MEPDTEEKSYLSPKVYDILKRIVQVVLPEVATLYFGLATQWDFPEPDKVVASITLITTFLGVILTVSSIRYNASDAKYFGEIEVEKTDEGTVIHRQVFNEDPRKNIGDMDEVRLKVVQK